MGKQKRYTKEFKLKAAELVVHHGYTRAEAAKRLDVSQWSIGQWIKKFRNSGDLVEDEQTRHETEQDVYNQPANNIVTTIRGTLPQMTEARLKLPLDPQANKQLLEDDKPGERG